MDRNPKLLFWFSKPEEAIKHRMNDFMGTKQKEHVMLVEQLSTIKDLIKEKQTKLKKILDIPNDDKIEANAQEMQDRIADYLKITSARLKIDSIKQVS